MRFTSTPPLDERISKLREELDAFIDERAAVIAKENPGVPVGVCRNLLIARTPDCECRQYLEIKRQDDAA
jgi:hypothetical protein